MLSFIVTLQLSDVFIVKQMGVVKTELFSEELNELALLFKVLGNPARLSIIKVLTIRATASNGELVEAFGLAQSTLSEHLRELKDANIITGLPIGTSVQYRINDEKWDRIKDVVNEFVMAY